MMSKIAEAPYVRLENRIACMALPAPMPNLQCQSLILPTAAPFESLRGGREARSEANLLRTSIFPVTPMFYKRKTHPAPKKRLIGKEQDTTGGS